MGTELPPAAAAGAQGGVAGAPWFSSYSRRQAYIMEVNARMDQLWRDIYTGHYGPETGPVDDVKRFREEFAVFMKQWQDFVGGLSVGSMMLPSTEEYAQRVDKQIQHWSDRLVKLGGKRTHQPYMPPTPPGGPPFPWGKLFTAVLVVGTVVGVVVVAGKLPDIPGRRYAR